MTILRIAGVPIQVHWTLAAMLAALALALGVTLGPSDALRATALVLAILASVVAHELGHVLAAARLGVRTRSILLMPLGGVARLDARWV
ncbi:MAG TPA: site-2 protease family protein, partial [Myxococcota bacterium]|nr:site-2 protease family protein [Myxococcota bacterium]